MRRICLLCTSLAILAAAPLQSQMTGQVAGSVRDIAGGPVAGAAVTVSGTTLAAVTSTDGSYTIRNVPQGQHTVRVNRIGFGQSERSVEVTAGQTATADFRLEAR